MHKNIKKIVHFGPSLEDKGGVVTVIKSILKLDFENELEIESIATTKESSKILTFGKAIFITIGKYVKGDANIAHIHMASKGSFYRKSIITIISKIFKVRVIIHVHGARFKEFYAEMNWVMKKYCKYVFDSADNIIVLTESWKTFFSKITDGEKINIVSNFVFIPENSSENIKDNASVKTILFMGRLGKRKGTFDLINATEILVNKTEDFKLILAGDGEIEKCNEMIKERKLEKFIETVGWINNEEKEQYLQNGDILVLPSYFESFGLSLIEAMSYKIPVIASWGGEMSEVVRDNIDGLLINPGDIEDLANKLYILITDKKMREDLGSNGYDRVCSNFSHIEIKKKLINIYSLCDIHMSKLGEKND